MEWYFDVTYISRGTMYVEADTREEAREKAARFDCVEDHVDESDFEDVDLDSGERNL